MPVQKLSLETLQKVQLHIRSELTLPKSESYPKLYNLSEEEVPEPTSLGDLGSLFDLGESPNTQTYTPNRQGQWFISSINPASVLHKLPGLALRSGIRLVGYLYRLEKNGIGVVWAVPEELSTTAQLEEALAACRDHTQMPHPTGALVNWMEAISGDRSPTSFLIASLLRREIKEFGATGSRCNWVHHRLIDRPPTGAWQWRTSLPKDLLPKISLQPDGKIVTEFFSCRTVAPVGIFQHLDQYTPPHYCSSHADRPIAIPQAGSAVATK